MLETKRVDSLQELEEHIKLDDFVDFMHTHLGQFGDPKPAIKKCVEYAFSDTEGKGGFVLLGIQEGDIVGAVIMNNSGMDGYIPGNVLVYVTVNSEYRNQGIGGKLVKKIFELVDGDVKLHVEHENPAKRLYERLGFTNKYAEMRYSKQ